MARFDYECPVHGVREYIHPIGFEPTACDCVVGPGQNQDSPCGKPLTKVFYFFPGCEFSTIRTVSDRDPAYWEWLNSDSVKADLKAGKLRPIGKHEDQAHGDGSAKVPHETTREKERRHAGYADEFQRLGRPTVEQQRVLQEQGKI